MDISEKGVRILKTVNLYSAFFLCGLSFSCFGPTLIDLAHLVDTDIKHISVLFSCLFGGYIFGGIAGGIYFDMTSRRSLMYTISNLVGGVTLFAVSWSKNITALIAWTSLYGIAIGALITGGNASILDYWGKDSKPYFQALQLSYSIGSLIGPILAAPFLGQYSNSTELYDSNKTFGNETHNLSDIENVILSTDIPVTDAQSKVTYFFIIIGSFYILQVLLSLFITILSPVDENNQKGVLTDSNDRSLTFKFVLVSLVCLLVASIQGLQFSYTQMLTVYATKGTLQLKTSTGSYMTSVYYISGTISRSFAILITIKFRILVLIAINIILLVLGTVVLNFLAESHEWALWVTTIFLGAGISSLFSASISWMENYIIITNKIMAILDSGSSLSAMVLTYVIGQFIVENPDVFNYVCLSCCVITIVLILILYFVLRKISDKYTNEVKK